MRAALFVLLALGATSALDVTPAAARSDRYFPYSLYSPSGYPFCMRSLYGDDDCSYATYDQCTTTASGIGLSCFANPANAYAQQPPVQPRIKKRERSSY